jgi:hypothetical protein
LVYSLIAHLTFEEAFILLLFAWVWKKIEGKPHMTSSMIRLIIYMVIFLVKKKKKTVPEGVACSFINIYIYIRIRQTSCNNVHFSPFAMPFGILDWR